MIGQSPTFCDSPILHPDVVLLKNEVAKLRAELTMLVLERDELLHHECKSIEEAYMLAVGALEYKAYQLECDILRMKRKTELIQAQKNRQQKPNLNTIEAVLRTEFAEYQARLEEKIHKMNNSLERVRGRALSDTERRDLKKLYHAIVRELHPDLHPGLSAEKIRLFHNAVQAFENGDLPALQVIATMVSNPDNNDTDREDSIVKIREEKEMLLGFMDVLKDHIAQIKSEFPYTMKSFVHNPERIADRKAELELVIHELTDTLASHTARIKDMLR